MRRIPDPVIFVVLVIVVSAAISAAMMPSVVSTRHLAVMRSLTLAPVVSIIVCALGSRSGGVWPSLPRPWASTR